MNLHTYLEMLAKLAPRTDVQHRSDIDLHKWYSSEKSSQNVFLRLRIDLKSIIKHHKKNLKPFLIRYVLFKNDLVNISYMYGYIICIGKDQSGILRTNGLILFLGINCSVFLQIHFFL